MNVLMNQWSSRVTIAIILLLLEGSFTPLIGLLYFKENMMMKIKRKNQTNHCLRIKLKKELNYKGNTLLMPMYIWASNFINYAMIKSINKTQYSKKMTSCISYIG